MEVSWSSLWVRPMTIDDAERIELWRYRGAWAIYDLPSTQSLVDELASYHTVLAGEDVVGFCCNGEAARVAGLPEDPAVLDVGLGMDPRVVGGGHGAEFGRTVLDYLANRYPRHLMRAVIQSWNERSLRMTERLGFHDVGELTVVQGHVAVPYRVVIRQQQPGQGETLAGGIEQT